MGRVKKQHIYTFEVRTPDDTSLISYRATTIKDAEAMLARTMTMRGIKSPSIKRVIMKGEKR